MITFMYNKFGGINMDNIEKKNGVQVDWNKYKGRDNNKAKKGYIGLCELLHKNGHRLESDYINTRTNIFINYNCGHKSNSVTPNNYKKGNGCPKCSGQCSEQAKEDFLDMLRENGHILLSEYKGAKTKVLIDFKCGHDPHWILPNNYKNGSRCAKCVGKSGQSKEYLFYIIKKNGHKLLSEYKGIREKILIDYNNGLKPCWVYPGHYKKNHGNRILKNSEQAKEEFYSILNSNNHILLSDYKNSNEKVLIDFKCGHEAHWVAPNHYKRNGKGCPKCARNSKDFAKEEFIKLLEENGHTLESEYINATTKVLVNFNCGHEPNLTKPNNYKNGSRCPKCCNKGEDALYKLLTNMFEKVEWQKSYENLKDKRLLSYDFYLPKYNLLIELDGEHHRKEMYYKSKKNITNEEEKDAFLKLCDRLRKDKIKNKFAKENNIPLLRIEYNSKIELKKWEQLIMDKIESI